MALPNENGEILGEAQWQWLEGQLDDEEADLLVIASGIQILAQDHRFEKWANFPKERDRLLQLVADKVEVPMLFLSGDRHISEVSKTEIENYAYPVYDITASSLTNPWRNPGPEENRYRIGEIIHEPNFTVMTVSWNDKIPTLQIRFVGEEGKELSAIEIAY